MTFLICLARFSLMLFSPFKQLALTWGNLVLPEVWAKMHGMTIQMRADGLCQPTTLLTRNRAGLCRTVGCPHYLCWICGRHHHVLVIYRYHACILTVLIPCFCSTMKTLSAASMMAGRWDIMMIWIPNLSLIILSISEHRG